MYRRTTDEVRRLLTEAFYTRLYCYEHGLVTDERQPPVDDLHRFAQYLRSTPPDGPETAAQTQRGTDTPTTQKTPSADTGRLRIVTGTDRLDSDSDYFAAGSSKTVLVELRGFEPLASSLRTRRATNCATAPGRA